jgi:hypothetical protein
MRKFIIFVILLVGVVLIMAMPASAITWGEPDNNGHPQVVAILFLRPDGYYSCSGTLLSPTLVMTAGHCTEGGGQVNLGTWVRNDPNIDIAGELPNYPSVAAWLAAKWVAGQAIPHPNFNDFAQFPDTYDVGVVLLSASINVPTYGQLPSLGYFDFLDRARGRISDRQAVIVGYGLQGAIPAFAQDDFTRYRALSAVINTGDSANVGRQNFMYTNNPGQGSGSGGTCSGDSGGPAFWIDPATGAETNIVMGINSYGIAPLCNGNDYQFRTDIADTLDFVNTYLP